MTEIKAQQGNIKTIEDVEAIISTDEVLLTEKKGQAQIQEVTGKNYRYVIHTLGPIWEGGTIGEADVLEACYVSSLQLAMKHGIRSVAFPSISTGCMHFPVQLAAKIAVRVVKSFIDCNPNFFEKVIWMVNDKMTFFVYDHEIME